MPSSLLYPSALQVSMHFFFTISSWDSNWLSPFYKWGSGTQKDWDLKCNLILGAQSEMPLVFIDLFRCRALPFTSLSMTYFFWPYSNLSSWVDKRSKIPQSEIITKNNLPEVIWESDGKGREGVLLIWAMFKCLYYESNLFHMQSPALCTYIFQIYQTNNRARVPQTTVSFITQPWFRPRIDPSHALSNLNNKEPYGPTYNYEASFQI